jgi:Protein of unknown function (DUF2934)
MRVASPPEENDFMVSRRISDDAKPVPKAPVTAPRKSAKTAAGELGSAAAVAAPAAATAVVPVAKPRKPRTAPGAKPAAGASASRVKVSADERRGMIARAAYLRGQSRGFPPGGEAEDWLVAENEIDALLSGGSGPAQ